MKKTLIVLSASLAIACEHVETPVEVFPPCEDCPEVVEDCGMNMIEIQIWNSNDINVGGHVEILSGGSVLVDEDCESWGFCGLMYAEPGDYDITVTYDTQVLTKSITLDSADEVTLDHTVDEFATCTPWLEEQVNFYFENDA